MSETTGPRHYPWGVDLGEGFSLADADLNDRLRADPRYMRPLEEWPHQEGMQNTPPPPPTVEFLSLQLRTLERQVYELDQGRPSVRLRRAWGRVWRRLLD